MNKPFASTVFPWLRANLGKRALGALTSTDQRALESAVHIVSLWNFADAQPSRDLPAAFRACVLCMQPNTREFAFHAIAHVCDWHTRQEFWDLAGLPFLARRMVCLNEPQRSND